MAPTNVLLRLWAPLGTACIALAPDATLGEVAGGVSAALGGAAPVLTRGGRHVRLDDEIGALASRGVLALDVGVRVRGGKGGFGQNLRAEGGRMSKKLKNMSQDDCRDLHGRRLSTVKEAQALAEYLAKEPERRKALDDAQQKRYERLERMLGREPRTSSDFAEAAAKLAEGESGESEAGPSAGPSAGSSTSSSTSSATVPKRKDFVDDAYVEQSRENVERVRGAVAAAMKRRKKVPRAPSAVAS